MTKKEVLEILNAEYQYWRNTTDPRIEDLSMGAIGALSNVAAAIALGKTAEQHALEIECRDKRDPEIRWYPEPIAPQDLNLVVEMRTPDGLIDHRLAYKSKHHGWFSAKGNRGPIDPPKKWRELAPGEVWDAPE